ncbi:MAG: hypothetical protein C4523_12305 [Myxococcales bacterium]|nr:MAG: hypothetical protein C4523_12305 [Myxococcales bacterium]
MLQRRNAWPCQSCDRKALAAFQSEKSGCISLLKYPRGARR